MNRKTAGSVGARASLHVCEGVSVRLLALELGAAGEETYHVSFRSAPGAAFRAGLMRHKGGPFWDVIEGGAVSCENVGFGSPDEVFALALGESPASQRALEAKVREAAPLWPTSLTQRLARRRLSGAGTVAFDADWFSSELATSALDRPLLFPNATSKLGLAALERASAVIRGLASAVGRHEDRMEPVLPQLLLRALSAEQTTEGALDWGGDGRLIAEYRSGEHGQLGADLADGCEAVLGSGPLHVVFDAAEPLGLGLGPLQPPDVTAPGGDADSVGRGAEVGEVDAEGAAERAGVQAGMVLSRLSNPDLLLSSHGQSSLPFEAVLDEIDQRRAAGLALSVTFDTAAAVTQLYAVEMPAAATLAAFAAALGVAPPTKHVDVGVGAALRRVEPLWREETPRLFLGEAGSLTCAHTDICPQLELAHGLLGLKLLGIASHEATPRLSAEHGEDEDEQATRVPTDRPLTPRQARLLSDADVTLALISEGALAVFDSGALHFASNGEGGLNGAIYHGMITAAAVPRLRLAAAQAPDSSSSADGAYRDHLFAADLLRLVESREPAPRSSRRG